ncbi:hypothetical protein GCM10027200_71600 [Lentzea nigeriaca]
MSRVMSEPVQEHLSGEQAYRVVSVVDARHRRSGRGLTCRGGAADDRGDHDRPGPGLVEGVGPLAAPERDPRPGKIVCDLAIALALGGDCLADIAALRAEPGVFGPVASDPPPNPG